MNHNEFTDKFDVNNYSFNTNSHLGIYLIHGFSSTTYEVQKIAQHLADQGYQVRADNLPGHGTSIQDCNNTSHTEWLSFVEQGVAEMYSSCDKVIVIGVSMGAVLALHLGTIFPLDGLISASALFKFRSEFDVRVLARLFHKIKPSIPKKSTFQPNKLKLVTSGFYGYNKYPVSALNQMRMLVDKVRLTIHTISSPLLLIHSKQDQTAIFDNFNIIKNSLRTPNLDTLVLEEAGHNVFDTQGKDQAILFNAVDNFIKDKFDV